ncbi:hypothetical protein CYLTODRAFT_439477 [Cylindrobasidium torrendii FP15055 ss-10]|uniref:Uncharacterized protein n=1 Tax=Cylindrobasidium torrendii FP15055 ss-10 TaxID=1314674 RepID=A0A0D7BUN3_9AGAR|nr:hypothetical protein CYLTODRAFT_439477 [Cylindrobasidium torrendii FP15055 ss-10]
MSTSSQAYEQSNGLALRALKLVEQIKAVLEERLEEEARDKARIRDLEDQNNILRERLNFHQDAVHRQKTGRAHIVRIEEELLELKLAFATPSSHSDTLPKTQNADTQYTRLQPEPGPSRSVKVKSPSESISSSPPLTTSSSTTRRRRSPEEEYLSPPPSQNQPLPARSSDSSTTRSPPAASSRNELTNAHLYFAGKRLPREVEYAKGPFELSQLKKAFQEIDDDESDCIEGLAESEDLQPRVYCVEDSNLMFLYQPVLWELTISHSELMTCILDWGGKDANERLEQRVNTGEPWHLFVRGQDDKLAWIYWGAHILDIFEAETPSILKMLGESEDELTNYLSTRTRNRVTSEHIRKEMVHGRLAPVCFGLGKADKGKSKAVLKKMRKSG